MNNLDASNWQDLVQNKQFWGVVVAFVAMVAKAFGVEFDTQGLANNLVALAGVLFTLYGTVTSTKKIKSVAGMKVNRKQADHPDNQKVKTNG